MENERKLSPQGLSAEEVRQYAGFDKLSQEEATELAESIETLARILAEYALSIDFSSKKRYEPKRRNRNSRNF